MIDLKYTHRSEYEKSRKAEKKLAKKLKGKVTPRSGAGRKKGDVWTDEEMVEHKRTASNRFIFKYSIWEKLEKEAEKAGKIPLLIIEFSTYNLKVIVLKDIDYSFEEEKIYVKGGQFTVSVLMMELLNQNFAPKVGMIRLGMRGQIFYILNLEDYLKERMKK